MGEGPRGRAEHLEALGELDKLYEREKAWDKLADVCSARSRVAGDADEARRDPAEARHPLHREGRGHRRRRSTAWQALLAVEPENRRAQDALKKLYLQQKDWDELEKFYAAQDKCDEYIRVLERQAETEDERPSRARNARSPSSTATS